ncbi:SEH-associated protein 4 [Cyphellophora attinorum]|uniref:SEH-associated protein 4 n=1 Tax=Cyphellophora attinorum TaxID=1664694 RepID=A0A0N1HZ04_9EURO|nr:SEH-associated protein 4 [Phialophora attinorum]KPI43860.1 SEH-associated protein 4 [Phialophora attinorum]
MEAAIRFSQNSVTGSDQRFLIADVANRNFKLCNIRNEAHRSGPIALEYDTTKSASKVPPFRAFDWHPHPDFEHLVAVGQSSGEVALLNLSEGKGHESPPIVFPVKPQRPCNAVSISSEHLLAVGLERPRSDFCLHVWDFAQRLPPTQSASGSSNSYLGAKGSYEPLHKFANGDTVYSSKFFPTSPQLLLAGLRSQQLKLYDLREGNNVSNTGLQFSTRCVNNLAIDWQDENFFASCSPKGKDAGICLWDRRMTSRMNPMLTPHANQRPESSLELTDVVGPSAEIWSLRFSKSKRGCLGTLSSDGKLRMYEFGRDMAVEEYKVLQQNEEHWEKELPQGTYLERAQDVEKVALQASGSSEGSKVVSFDFRTRQDASSEEQPFIVLMSNGNVVSAVTTASPVPTLLHPSGFIMYGNKFMTGPTSKSGGPTEQELTAKMRALKTTPSTHLSQSQVQVDSRSRKDGTLKRDIESSLDDEPWQADMGLAETATSVPKFISQHDIAKARCAKGYGVDPSVNKDLVSQSVRLTTLWNYVERASQFNKWSVRNTGNLDLSYLGIYSVWMEDVPAPELTLRNIGGSVKYATNVLLSKSIEGLVKQLQLPNFERLVYTNYVFNRQLCLYLSNASWTIDQLKEWTKDLVDKGQHSKAAFVALLSGEEKLARDCLLDKKANKDQRTLGLAFSGAMKRRSSRNRDHGTLFMKDPDDDDKLWLTTVDHALSTITEVYARGVLMYLKNLSWEEFLRARLAIPLRLRLAVAIRHLDDSALTKYISKMTSTVAVNGDLEGVHLTGLATTQAFDLFQSYIIKTNDLQTSVLALCRTIPRYITDAAIRRRFESWKAQYRADIMSWGGELYLERAEFDVMSAKHAIDNVTGKSLIKPPPPQVRLVCSHCNGDLAHHSVGQEDSGTSKSGSTVTHNSKTNPLTPAVAAAKGTVCPHCAEDYLDVVSVTNR